jgi:tetratricopeptide (TPR) repeat protein
VDLAALATLLDGQKEFAQAETLYQRALPSHGETAILLSNLAALYQSTRRFPLAQKCYRSVLKVKRQAFGAAHPTVAVTLNNLGMLHHSQGDVRRAERCLGDALRILRRRVDSKHFQYRLVATNIALPFVLPVPLELCLASSLARSW